MTLRSLLRRWQHAEINETRIASPCGQPWESMRGDDQVRFCRACRLNVYNLSEMDVEEAAELMARDDDRLCIRFYRRADGTLLTRDCPVGAARVREGRRHAVARTAAAVMSLSVAGAVLFPMQGARARPAAHRMSLFSAARSDDPRMARAMLDAGISPDIRTGAGTTPLMRAAAAGSVEVVELLLERGADVNARDEKGVTALRAARLARRSKVVALLKRRGAEE